MHYLVTGGCGFIGSHLVERLVADGHTVTVLDDLSSGKREHLPPQAHLHIGDITAPGIFDTLVAPVDGCFHLAAIVSVQRSRDEWLRTHQVNAGGLVALLDALARGKRKIPVVFASSAAVYGDGRDIPLRENMRCRPLSPYGADKLAGESHARLAAALHKIPTAGLRFFNVYGPRQDPSSAYSGVISIFVDRMQAHAPLTVFGDGEQSRDFVYVGDVVEALISAMRGLENGRITHGVFNVCTGAATSVNGLIAILARILGMRVTVTHVSRRAGDIPSAKSRLLLSLSRLFRLNTTRILYADVRPGDIRLSLGDPALARRQLGVEARVRLEDGLKRLLAS